MTSARPPQNGPTPPGPEGVNAPAETEVRPAHPINPFLASWYEDGEASYAEHLRVYRALSLAGPWDLARLRRVLRALLVHRPSDLAAFNRCFERFFSSEEVPEWLEKRLASPDFSEAHALEELAQATRTAPLLWESGSVASSESVGVPGGVQEKPAASGAAHGSPTSQSRPPTEPVPVREPPRSPAASRSFRSLFWGLGILLLLGVFLGIQALREPAPVATPALPATPASAPSNPEIVQPLPQATTVTVPVPVIQVTQAKSSPWQKWSLMALGVLLPCLLLMLLRRWRTPPVTPHVNPDGTGRLELPDDSETITLYTAHELHRLAYQVGVQEDDGLQVLDAPATVRATLRRGGLLEPQYRPLRLPSALRLVVPVDWRQEPISEQALTELLNGIRARGVRVEWQTWRSGRMPLPAAGTVTLFCVRADLSLPPDIPWKLPSSAFVELREPGLWGPETSGLPRRLFSLLPEDLLLALREASSDLQSEAPLHQARRLSSLERLEEARGLAGVAALAGLFGPCSLAALEQLRQQVYPQLSPFCWQRVLELRLNLEAEGSGPDHRTRPALDGPDTGQVRLESGHWACEPRLAQRLIQGMNPHLQLEVLDWQAERLARLSPEVGSPAWVRHRVQSLHLELMRLPLRMQQRDRKHAPGPWRKALRGCGLVWGARERVQQRDRETLRKGLQELQGLMQHPLARALNSAFGGAPVIAAPVVRWLQSGEADDRDRAMAGESGLLPPASSKMPLSRPQRLAVAGLVATGLVCWAGLGWLQGRSGSSLLEVTVANDALAEEVAFAVSFWSEDGPFDPQRATLATPPDFGALWPRQNDAFEQVIDYPMPVPPGARLVRVYAITRGGMEFRDQTIEAGLSLNVALSVAEKPVPVEAALGEETNALARRRIFRMKQPAMRPSGYPEGRLRVVALSVPPSQLRRVQSVIQGKDATDFLMEESLPMIPVSSDNGVVGIGAFTQGVLAANGAAFVCPQGKTEPPCVHLYRLPDSSTVDVLGAVGWYAVEGAPAESDPTPTPVPLSPTPTPVPLSPTPTPGPHPTARPIMPTPAPATPPPPTPTEAPPTPTPPSATPTTAPGTPTPPKEPPVSITWLSIPGTGPDGFMMGSPDGEGNSNDGHRVTVPAFQMSKTEVTVAQYRACVQAKGEGCTEPGTGGSCNWGKPDRDNHPINCIDWDQARAFAAWAGARLPSEAEWEYAATGGGKTKYSGTDALSKICEYGNVADKTAKAANKEWTVVECTDGYAETAPVGSFKDGAWGLKDLTGNVWEWVEDCYEGSYNNAPSDGKARTKCSDSFRVIRGGGWVNVGSRLRAANRYGWDAVDRSYYVGFRLARVPPVQ